MILLTKRLNKVGQRKDTDERKMKGDKTPSEQGRVKGCKAKGGAGTQ